MRYLVLIALACFALPGAVCAQGEKAAAVKIDSVRIGFRSSSAKDELARFKVGLWTPVFVKLTAGPDGLRAKDGRAQAELAVEASDSEDVGTIYSVPVELGPGESRTLITYIKPGIRGGSIKVSLQARERTFAESVADGLSLDLGSHLYLSLGGQVPDLQAALKALAPPQSDGSSMDPARETAPRFAAFESEAAFLPMHWFGYQPADIVVFNTTSEPFLRTVLGEPARLKALAQWVRRGGKLVIPVAWEHADLVRQLLQNAAWQPPVPIVPPPQADVKKNAIPRLLPIEEFAQTGKGRIRPFPEIGERPVPVAFLESDKARSLAWEVWAQMRDGRALLGRMPYGLGQIVLIAFPLDRGEFLAWEGRVDFLMALVQKLDARVTAKPGQAEIRFDPEAAARQDLTTDLQQALDVFDVPVIPFGWVALFIVIYILVVGPLDYLLLKNVFKRLEWTWITFPVVVLAVSALAYVFAYAIKGRDLKVNKVDVIDFDLRTQLDGKQRTAGAFAYGQSFFTILSPVIKNYTVGLEPNPGFWDQARTGPPLRADVVSWLGRPEWEGAYSMGRPRTQSFLRKPYRYAAEAAGLVGVPIPVWTTKSLTASWETPLAALPFHADLHYHLEEVRGKELRLTGTLHNNLAVDLQDVWIFYRDRCYAVADSLPSKGKPLALALDPSDAVEIRHWPGKELEPGRPLGLFNPTGPIKRLLFLESMDTVGQIRNHSLRSLDQSWRLPEESRFKDGRIRDAVLFARVALGHGPFRSVAADPKLPLPTYLWLDGLPGPGLPRPMPDGMLAQDTFVRVLLPVRPGAE